jgi:DNA-binding NarL/FixJ family response regulator
MRILVADHHLETLWALKTRLNEEPGISIIGEASDSETLLRLGRAQLVDLILMDGELPGSRIDLLITQLHNLTPKPKVIVMDSNPEYGRKYLRAGADAFVSKGDEPEWLFETLRRLTTQPTREVNHL